MNLLTPTLEDTFEAIRAFRKGNTLGGLSIREMIDEGCK
jgi:hypothetical protein